jgi:spore coat polysaccharide biosynthesis protein SpsF
MDLIVQARMGSTRLPNKILYNVIDDISFLKYFYNRTRKSEKINRIIIATTSNKKDDIIEDVCIQNDWDYYRGDEFDVLDRFYQTSIKFNCKNIIRITSDCPLIDYKIIDEMIEKFNDLKDINCLNMYYHGEHGFPDGTNLEIFTFNSLNEAWKNANEKSDREHVSTYIHRNMKVEKFKVNIPINIKVDLDHLHLSLDTKQDLINLRKIISYFHKIGKYNNFTYIDILEYLNNLPKNKLELFYKYL